MYLYSYNELNRISNPINIIICDFLRFLWILDLNICFQRIVTDIQIF